MEYAALDLETTGLDPVRDRVIEAGAVAFTPVGVIESIQSLADPGRAVPEAVLRLTGIQPADLRASPPAPEVLAALARFIEGRQAVGHGAVLDVAFLEAAGLWTPGRELIDTLTVARILLPDSPSHSLPLLSLELGLEQPRPHRALDDADATRQLFLRLRDEAGGLEEGLKEAMLALVAPYYPWAIAGFFADSLTAPAPEVAAAVAATVLAPRPLRRTGAKPDSDPAALAALLGPGGPMSAANPDYEHREAQLQMLLAVAQTLQRSGTLIVEAGTGTGKGLAYLIPALARAVSRRERVVVSTNTHTLQEQLMAHDLPALRDWLPWDFQACILKGRPSYVSLRRWRRYLAEPCADADELAFKLKVLVWLHQTETGDRSELRLHGREEVFWARIASDPLDCVGVHCTAEDCFVHRARAEAEKADLVVVNHALLMADAVSAGGVLPEHQYLIIDEAHHLEEAATQGLRQELEGPGLVALLERVGAEGGLIAELARRPELAAPSAELSGAAEPALRSTRRAMELFACAGEWLTELLAEQAPSPPPAQVALELDPEGAELDAHAVIPARRDESVRLEASVRQGESWEHLTEIASDLVVTLAALDTQLRRAVGAGRDLLLAGGDGGTGGAGGATPDSQLLELEIIRGRLFEAATLIREALLEPDPNRVYWLTLLARSSSVLIRSAPLEVGDVLREGVYAQRSAVVLTSASLSVGGSFDYFRRRVGLHEGVEALSLESPFDYLRQAVVCLPTDLPEPTDPGFEPLLVEVIADVVRRIKGRTLALFTSHRQLRDVYYELKHRNDLDEVLILAQGVDGQRRQLLTSFSEDLHPLLMGTASFWEGVDIPGDGLSCVIVVRLPFPVPTDPVFAARAERLADPFVNLALPMAALRLKQGFGRLIRTGSDRGAVVIMDARISSREYGRAFLSALPPAARYQGPVHRVGEEVERWVGAFSAVG
jgi:Rad3-related DNA helicase/DNA polymerase III epsilon subunit-like protein